MGSIILRALGWGVVGLFVVPLVMFGIMARGLSVRARNAARRAIPAAARWAWRVVIIASALPGAIVFFLFVLIRGLNRRRQPPAG